jgi:V/A-type H+-transporting ATPase subunit I
MPLRDQLVASPMRRMAVVAPHLRLRRVLIEVADSGSFEPDAPRSPGHGEAGEASIEDRAAEATTTAQCAILPGWISAPDVDSLNHRIHPLGGALAELPQRRGATPPTKPVDGGLGQGLRPLVTTYATVPYRDIDPTLFAGITYMAMFGMMFGDVAHGSAVVILGLVARAARSERYDAVHRAAPFLIGAGLAAVGFGFLYGEAFGPTGLVPTLWLRPLDEPETLLLAGLVVGSFLLAVTFLLGSINRWREAGARGALYDAAGIGGALMFAGAAAVIGGVAIDSAAWLEPTGIGVAAVGAFLTFVGLFTKAGLNPSGLMQALIEMFDTVLRLGSNIVSFTRLAAFGLTHAVITEVVWDGTVALWDGSGFLSIIAAVVLFTVGNIAAFALSGLVGAIQALRLEYYELFSRLFVTQGRPFNPWHIPSTQQLETS